MNKVLTSIALLLAVCLNVQCQKTEIHKNDGTTVEIPTSEIDSITFSMTNPFNFETRTVKLNSGYDMPIIGIGTFYLSTAQAEESVYNALKVGMRLIDTADIYGNEVEIPEFALGDEYANIAAHIMHHETTGAPVQSMVTPEENIKVMKLLETVERSAYSGNSEAL